MHSTWAVIDTDSIRNNVRLIRELTGTDVMAVVKANAYGHGAVPVALAALDGGAAWCGIARYSEAMELRQAGIDCPLLMLSFVAKERLEEMIRQGVSLTVWDPDQLSLLSAAASQAGQPAKIHLKVDTGMSRIGVQPEEALDLARLVANTPGIEYEGLYSHFARADEKNPVSADLQCERFEEVVEQLEGEGLLPPLVHIANSAASIKRGETGLSFVRLGIAMYGLPPSQECPLPDGFKPALEWKSVLSQVKILPPGRGVSYGHQYITTGQERIGTVHVGYADGYRRVSGNKVLVGGIKVPVIGRVTMDQILVQLDEVPDAKAGDEVVLIGRQGEGLITAEDVAEIWGTVNYEVICAIGARVPRLYPKE